MPSIQVLNMQGAKVGEMELNESIFAIEPNVAAMHLVVRSILANKRQGTQSALTRGNTLEFTVPTLPQYGELRLTFTTMNGQTYTAEGFDADAEELTIIGNVGEGFKLTP